MVEFYEEETEVIEEAVKVEVYEDRLDTPIEYPIGSVEAPIAVPMAEEKKIIPKKVPEKKVYVKKEKEIVIVDMPEKVEIEGRLVYPLTAVFSKAQFAQMLADANMDARASVGQSSMFFKGADVDTKVLERTGKEIVAKYISSKSKVKNEILCQFEGVSEEDMKENIKTVLLSSWVEPIKLALMVDEELDMMMQDGEDAGKTMQERVATSQKGKIAKLCGVASDKRNEMPDEILSAHLKTMTSKYGLAAICGIKYKNITPQEVISIMRKRALEAEKA